MSSMMRVSSWAVVTLAWFSLPRRLHAANASEPHPHQGVILKFKMDGKPQLSLSDADMGRIDNGEMWLHSEEVNGVGKGLGIRDVAAPWEVVFDQITDLKRYVGKVPMLSDLQVYHRKAKGKEVVEKAMYSIKVVPGYKFEYFVEHHASKSKKTLTFFLDYDRHSDFNDMQGKWFLEEHPSKPGWTRVYYECKLSLFGYAPAIVKKLLTSKAGSNVKEGSARTALLSAGHILMEGGVPIKDASGRIIGAVGVSGVKPDEDAAVAKAAVEALKSPPSSL
jgi:ribosome-associated toxin RatA of RatAB toxin-antitoxin module